MSYRGDFAFGQVLDIKFTSRNSLGVPSTLSGVVLALGRANSTSSFSQGLSLVTDFGGIVGRNAARITTASSATQFLEGHDYELFVLAGQVSPLNVFGEVAAEFSINNRFGGALLYGPLSGVASTSNVSLPSGATTTNDIYNGALLVMSSGPGMQQARYISDYTGAGLFAQLDSALGTAVTSATTAVVYPGAPSVPGSINSIVPGTYSGVTVGVNNLAGAFSAATVRADMRLINGVLLTGDGSTSSWGPA